MMRERGEVFILKRYDYEMENLGNFERVFPLTNEDLEYIEFPEKYDKFLKYS